MQKLARSFFPILLAGLLGLALTGCTPSAKKARYLEKADRAYAEGKYDEAEIEYKNVLQIEGLNAHAISRLGIIYSEEGRTGRAVAYILKGQELLPEDLDLRLKLAEIRLVTGKLKEAQEQAEYVLTHRPQDPEAPMMYAMSVANLADVNAARARLLSLPPPAPTSAPVLAALGMLEYRQLHLKEAEALFEQAVAADPKYATGYASLGLLRIAQNDQAGADQALKKAADLSPLRSSRRIQYVQFKLRSKDLPGAKAVLEEITKKTPDYLPAWVALADIAAAEEKYTESSKLIAKVFDRDPDNVDARLFRGRLYTAMKEYDKAIGEFGRLTAAFPRLPVAHFELGRAYAAAGENNKAIDSLNQAVTLAPSYVEAIIPLATLDIHKGDLSSAIVLLRRLIQQRPDLTLAKLLLADAYRGQGNFDDAIAIYRDIEAKSPKNPQPILLRGQVLLQQKKLTEARAAFNRVLELLPDNANAEEQLVNIDMSEKNYAAAQARVDAMIVKDPKAAGPYLFRAQICIFLKETSNAEIALKKAIALQPESPAAYYLLASLYFNTHQLDRALANLADLIAKNPKDEQAWMLTGVLHDELKDHAAARDSYEKVLAINPKSLAALNNLAYLYSEVFVDLDKALELAQRGRDLNPQEPHTADTLGWIIFKKRQYSRALPILEESAAKLADTPEIQFHLGMTHYMLGNEAQALVALQRAMIGSSNFVGADEARRSLAVLTMGTKAGDADSRELLDEALKAHPDDPIALTRQAVIFEREGKIDKAIASNQAALQANPSNLKVLLSLARLYSGRQDMAKAMDMAKAARKAAPADPNAARLLGRLAFQSGDYSWAMSLLQEAARSLPNDEEVLFDFAQAAYSVGRVEDATTALRSALEISSTFHAAARARQMLELIGLATNPAATGSAAVEQALKANAADVPALMAKAAISDLAGNAGAAKQAYEAALGKYPGFTPAMKGLTLYYAKHPGDDQKGFDLGTKARAAFPDDADLAKALGIVVYRRGDFSRAVSLLKESSAKRADDAELMFYLGMAQARLKNAAASKQSLRAALELGLTGDLAIEARKTMAEQK